MRVAEKVTPGSGPGLRLLPCAVDDEESMPLSELSALLLAGDIWR
jgi:hypothetical protein